MEFFGKETQGNKFRKNIMKKILVMILTAFFCNLIFAQEQQEKSETERLMLQWEQKYGDVKHLELPDSFLQSFDLNDIIYFGKPSVWSKIEYTDKIEFMQKGKPFKLIKEAMGTNVFYQYKTTFRVIDHEGQVVQLLDVESDEPAMYIYDCDFDGYQDLLLPYEDDDGNRSYTVYYWSNVQKKFKADSRRINSPQFDPKHKKIVEKETYAKGSFRTYIYTIYEFRFGIKRFAGSYKLNFVLNNNQEPEDFSFVFWESEEAKRTKLGEYMYEAPSIGAFTTFSEDEKKTVRKEYNKMIKMLALF